MGQIKGLSLRRSIALYILAFLLLALALIAGTSALCSWKAEAVQAKYPADYEKFYLTSEDGRQLGDGARIGTQPARLSPADQRQVDILEALPMVAAPLYSVACVLAAALLFYRNKLKGPLTALRSASEKIARNDLDFTVPCYSEDELGQLCRSFEQMRATLAQNFDQMWRQVEERRRLNAAFAHELRTPLTVLRGCCEMLQIGTEPKAKETALTMERHIGRIQQYVFSMSRLSRLEDGQPDFQKTSVRDLAGMLRDAAQALCVQHGLLLEFRDETKSETLLLDPVFVTEVGENLVSNAVRYGKERVTLTLAEDGGLRLVVQDDGPGFSEKARKQAAVPFFTEAGASNAHFGLGLYLCKLLCRQHGGMLEIENTPVGARVTAVFRTGVFSESR